MFSPGRREKILQHLAARGAVEVWRLAADLACSPKTIRRDLDELEQAGHVRRVHGGAISIVAPELPPVVHRADKMRRAKEVIATLAAARVPAGGLVYLGGGSTVLALAVRLCDLPKRTIFVTNMLDIAQILGQNGRHEVHLVGGELDPPTRTVIGPEAYRFMEARLFDVAVIGATAISEAGVMGPTTAHIAIAEVLRHAAQRRIVVADSTKFGKTDRYTVLRMTEVEEFVTDRRPPPRFRTLIEQSGGRLVYG
jgi:DeoR/GlpR family transcriptional regulator of sugar metabolism